MTGPVYAGVLAQVAQMKPEHFKGLSEHPFVLETGKARKRAFNIARDLGRLDEWFLARVDTIQAVRDVSWSINYRAQLWASMAAVALVSRELLTQDAYDVLTLPWRTVVGPIHSEDVPL